MNFNDARYIRNVTQRDGGGTFTVLGELKQFADGYMVGGVTPSKIVSVDDVQAILDFATENGLFLTHPSGNFFLGTWLFNGEIHLDVSERLYYEKDATIIASYRNELAIWDCANGTEIFV